MKNAVNSKMRWLAAGLCTVLLAVFSLPSMLYAAGSGQTRKLSGTVVDFETGEPVIGASVSVVGKKVAGISDLDGNFSIELSPEENEQTIASLLQEHPELQLVELPWYEGFAHGRPELADGNPELTKCVRIFPHRMAGEGHFLALLYKKKDGEADTELRLSEMMEVQLSDCTSVENMQMEISITTLQQNTSGENFVEQSEQEAQDINKKRKRKTRDVDNLNLNGKARGKDKNSARERLTLGGKKSGAQSDAAVLEEFLQDITPTAGYTLADMDIHNGQVYYIQNRVPAGRGIPFLRNGLYFGELRKGRFEPSQSLAMALHASDYASVLDFPQEDERVRRYLGGETIDVEDLPCERKKSWQLVCVDGYPLGWGKLVNGTLKNKYHPGWRMTV